MTRLARQAHLQVEEFKLEVQKSRAEEAEKRHHDKQEKEAERLRLSKNKGLPSQFLMVE